MQRTEERLHAVLPFRLVRGRETSWVHTIDVSKHALFFATEEQFEDRSLLRLRFDACGREIDAWAMVVRQGVCRGVRGAAVRFYARDHLLTEIWNRFIVELERSYRELGKIEVEPSEFTYLVRVKDTARLADFGERHLEMQLPYRIHTSLRRQEGSEVTLRIEHPSTAMSFDLSADVVRSWADGTPGMEVSLHPLEPDELASFRNFVASGRLEVPSWLVPGREQYEINSTW
jgi:hypothetical protein